MATVANDTKRLGLAIEQARTAKGLSRPQLATKLGLDRTYLWRIETGETDPSLTTLRAIASALGVKPATLMNR